MLYSMTGYGRAENTVNEISILAEIRSLNGKQLETRLSIPPQLKPFEIEIRKIITESLKRGSVECSISIKRCSSPKTVAINTALLKSYYNQIQPITEELNLPHDNILPTLLKLPDVVTPNTDSLTEDEWALVQSTLQEAINYLLEHRKKEGDSLEKDLLLRIENIENLEEANAILAPGRLIKIKEQLHKNLQENLTNITVDSNRLEQEIIYYIEKLDISEEQVRLKNHCAYFKELLAEKEIAKGKKLSFLLQEMGREINTTGSKANDTAIQKNVVLMKDELEKAKEQILNIL